MSKLYCIVTFPGVKKPQKRHRNSTKVLPDKRPTDRRNLQQDLLIALDDRIAELRKQGGLDHAF
ncbi:hypothetical protein H6F89_28490 [Cyanobacteria bacterium FACHB-63]|nr:hypothetical protein [Cyanobacteria bacterium FACHB-63]